MDFSFRSQYFLNGPKFKGNKPRQGTAAFQKRQNQINEWTNECQIHLMQIEEDFKSKGEDSPSSIEIDSLLKEKMDNIFTKESQIQPKENLFYKIRFF